MSKEGGLIKNRGTTLVEMVVVFALLSIFMVSVTQVISAGIMLFNNINFMGTNMEVSDMVLTKVGGVLESANGEMEAPKITADANGNSKVSMYDRNRTKINLLVENKKLKIVYPTVESDGSPTTNIGIDGERQALSPYIWTFSEKSYHGYLIESLTIEEAGAEYPDNVYKITLVLGREGMGEYTSCKYVKCYSLPETRVDD